MKRKVKFFTYIGEEHSGAIEQKLVVLLFSHSHSGMDDPFYINSCGEKECITRSNYDELTSQMMKCPKKWLYVATSHRHIYIRTKYIDIIESDEEGDYIYDEFGNLHRLCVGEAVEIVRALERYMVRMEEKYLKKVEKEAEEHRYNALKSTSSGVEQLIAEEEEAIKVLTESAMPGLEGVVVEHNERIAELKELWAKRKVKEARKARTVQE